MNRIFGIFFLFGLFFFGGCFSSGKGAASRQRARTECQCAETAHTAWQRRDEGIRPRRGGEVSFRLDSEPGLLLSMYSAHPAIVQIVDHDVLEALVNLNPHTGELTSELASYWEIDRKRTSIIFHLEEAARWHDGQPFTSDDVVYTFKQLLDPAGGALNRVRFEDVANVEALTGHSVLFELDRPRPGFLADISRVMILPEHLLKNTTVASNAFARAPVGTGPYMMSHWDTGQQITIVQNPDWRGEKPFLEKVSYRMVPEKRVALELFTSGTLDILPDVNEPPPENAVVVDYPQRQLNAWVFNVNTPYFSDATTRRAVSRLIDRKAISCSIMNCLADPVYSPWPETNTDTTPLLFSPGAARKLLASAGWRDTNRDGVLDRDGVPFEFSLLLPDSDMTGNRAVAVITHDLRKAGIKANTTVVSWAVYTDRLRRHQFDASILSVSIDRPFDAAELFHSDGARSGRNFGGFTDRQIDRLFRRLAEEKSFQKRGALQERIDQRLVLLQPMAFTVYPYQRALVQSHIHGIEIGSAGIVERKLWLMPKSGGAP